ncbi:MAG: recombination directionality factor, partial [Moraxellaceae bacterium]
LGTFIFRTTGFNSIRTLAARLRYFAAVSGNKLSCLPLQLTLRGKSTTQSYRTPIYFVDLTLRDEVTLKEAVQQARAIDSELSEHGFDQAALEQAAKQGYTNSCFEVDDEASELMAEFYPEEDSLEIQPQIRKQKQVSNGLDTLNVSSIEQGLRKSVTTVS